jgi:hypothetical protein
MSLILSGTDGLSDVDGTAATPAIRGTDANTGIFFPAADTIAFSEGGVEAMRIDSAGLVTIPNQVSVFAYLATTQTLVGVGAYTVSLNATGYNIGSAFNTSTYRFTAPVAGRYLVLGVAEMTGPPTQNHTGLTINGTTSASKGLPDQWNQCSANSSYTLGQNAMYKNSILNLAANDYVELSAYNAGNGATLYANRTNMAITLLG